jgi:hypothetical protein
MQSVSLVELGHGGVLVFCTNEETIIYIEGEAKVKRGTFGGGILA